ncbi:MAG: GSU2403 family nucleotidyltransferase fold protein [Actinomycetota bacterium]|nr:GSU2403 family nucleotidyltransferase fold protein [Actinomycetota bacterium]MDP3630822.1 GSU2403 family nucleotidyltransferase fold protein [Actinomycetota bacterium]
MQRQALEVQTLYAEMLEQLVALEAGRAIGHVPGGFVTKNVKGNDYYYFQHLEPGGMKRQAYVGRRDAILDAVVERFERGHKAFEADAASIQRLASLLRVGGAMLTDAPSARVLSALADAGVFRLGGVLVGTHAFTVIGNLLGVRWTGAAMRTQDLDVAASARMSVAVPDLTADIPGVLEGLDMGFLPVPAFDPASPSTSFKVRGQGLRVDLITPARGAATAPVLVPRLKAAAQPLRYLDYVIESTVRGAVVDGGGVLVSVPDPARFALHKVLIAGERPVIAQAKSEKDLRQAAAVLGVLLEDREGDIALALEDASSRGKGWRTRLARGLSALARLEPQTAARVSRMLDAATP